MMNNRTEVKNTYEELRAVIQNDLLRELHFKFPTYYRDIPDSFCDAVVRDVFDTSAWQDEGMYSQDDISLAVQRVVLDALQKDATPSRSDGRNCLNCSASMSADDEHGEQCLVCSKRGFEKVPEDGCCNAYN